MASGQQPQSCVLFCGGPCRGNTGWCAVIEMAPTWMTYGLPVSAGVALYVGASDLVPEVNREPGIRMALVFFLGVGGFLLLRVLLPAL